MKSVYKNKIILFKIIYYYFLYNKGQIITRRESRENRLETRLSLLGGWGNVLLFPPNKISRLNPERG